MSRQTISPVGFCRRCGAFPATSFGGGAGSSFIGCLTNCPRCGQISEVIPGRYDLVGERVSILLDPSISVEALSHLADIARRASEGLISAVEAQAEAEKIAPGAGKIFDIRNWSDQAQATLLGSVIAAASVLGAAAISRHPGHTAPSHGSAHYEASATRGHHAQSIPPRTRPSSAPLDQSNDQAPISSPRPKPRP